MSTVAAPVAATRTPVRPRRPLAKAATAEVLRRVLPAEGTKPVTVAAFGSSV